VAKVDGVQVQTPPESTPPQPSGAWPQATFAVAQVLGTHASLVPPLVPPPVALPPPVGPPPAPPTVESGVEHEVSARTSRGLVMKGLRGVSTQGAGETRT
jgi:hypothetical protein